METDEKIELGLIGLLAAGIWMFSTELPGQIGLGKLVLWASALLLLQSLVRDIWLLMKARRGAQKNPQTAIRCMCVESSVGIAGIVIGAILLGSGIGRPIPMGQWQWSLATLLVMGGGFLIKDYLLESKPWRIRKHKGHVNIVVKWRR